MITDRLQEVLDCFIDFFDKSEGSNFTGIADSLICYPIEGLEETLEEIEEIVDYSKCIENNDEENLKRYWGSIFGFNYPQRGVENVCKGNRNGSNSTNIIKYAILCSYKEISSVTVATNTIGTNIDFTVDVPSGTQISETVVKNKYLRLVNNIIKRYKPVGMKVAVRTITIRRT